MKKSFVWLTVVLFLLLSACSPKKADATHQTNSPAGQSSDVSRGLSDSDESYDENHVQLEIVSDSQKKTSETGSGQSTDRNSAQTSQKNDSSTDRKSSTIVTTTTESAPPEKTERTETFNGVQYHLKLVEKEKPSETWPNGRNLFETSNRSANASYDPDTDEILSFYTSDPLSEVSKTIPEEQAKGIAYGYLERYEKASDFRLSNAEYNRHTNDSGDFSISYAVYIQGYSSGRSFSVTLSDSGKIQSLRRHPYNNFAGITVPIIDEKALEARLMEELHQTWKNASEKYTVCSRSLSVDEGKVVLIFNVDIENLNPTGDLSLYADRHSGLLISYPVEYDDISKVKGKIIQGYGYM